MNTKENLLTTVSEECAEIQQAVSKTLRFGPNENTDHVMREFYQLCAVVEMCQEEGALPVLSDKERDDIIAVKKSKVQYYQTVSRVNGTLKEES